MRNIKPKVFWSVFLSLSIFLVALLLVMVGVVVALVFLIGLTMGVIIFYPFLPHIPVVQEFLLREYEFECNILRVMELAKFDTGRKLGWMSPAEIVFALNEISDRRISSSAIYISLGRLRKKGVITSGYVPGDFLKNLPKNAKGARTYLAFRLVDDSNYKPRKPEWLQEKQKGENAVAGVHAH